MRIAIGMLLSFVNTIVHVVALAKAVVRVHVRERDIPSALVSGNYEKDQAARVEAQRWINAIWQEKDECLSADAA